MRLEKNKKGKLEGKKIFFFSVSIISSVNILFLIYFKNIMKKNKIRNKRKPDKNEFTNVFFQFEKL